ncbi:MAG: adenosylcobinamide-phosphate synthase CbiB [Gammaproteobacteria bacterium]
MTLAIILFTAVALDYCLGELPNAYHPLVAFGRWAAYMEKKFLVPGHGPRRQQIAGLFSVFCTLIPCLLVLPLAWPPLMAQKVLSIIVLYFCIGARSLQQHAMAVYQALQQDDLMQARQQVGHIVSRQTENMSEADVRRAAIESVLENGSDAVFAPLFWFALLGPFGALLYRFSNTLDAMWGYKNERYIHFGWAAARLDDLLNWLPARLTALSYALLGNTRQALNCWRRHASLLESPNAGPVMAAGAGALNLRLGGPAIYHGQPKDKAWFGGDKTPENKEILRATRLVYRTLLLWTLTLSLVATLV